MASYLYGSSKWQDKITKVHKLIHALWTLLHSPNNLISHYLFILENVFFKSCKPLYYTLLNHEGVNCDTAPSCHWLFWRKKFCNKIRVSRLFQKFELCSMTDLHSTVPLTQGMAPGTSFWGLVSGKFSANLSRAFSQFFLLLFWRMWTSSIEDGLPVPKPACVRRSWSWICYQKLSRDLLYSQGTLKSAVSNLVL